MGDMEIEKVIGIQVVVAIVILIAAYYTYKKDQKRGNKK